MDPNSLRSVVRAALAVAASLLIAAAPAVGGAGSSRASRAVQAAGVPGQDETRRPAASPRIVDGTRDRFDWWDAAVGAAAGLGLLLVVVGGQAAWARRGAARRASDG